MPGNGTGTLRARNGSDSACWVRGRPVLDLVQERVKVTTGAPEIGAAGKEHLGRVTIAPGDSAAATLVWRGYRTADRATDVEQRLRVGLKQGSSPSTARLEPMPGHDTVHPFDLIDGGHLGVTTWAPEADAPE